MKTILFGSWIRIRIRIRVKSCMLIRIKVKIQKLAMKACRLTMEPWRVYSLDVADSHHFHEEQDPDPHESEKLDPDPH
jgi:hypothetical protein